MRTITDIINNKLNEKNIKLKSGDIYRVEYNESKYSYAKKTIILQQHICNIEIIDNNIKIEVK